MLSDTRQSGVLHIPNLRQQQKDVYCLSKYSFTGEIESVYFHDSFILRGFFEKSDLVLFFKDSIIIGHSFPPEKNRMSSTINPGEDRYALNELQVIFKDFSLQSMICVGYRTFDDKGNLIEDIPSRTLGKDDYPSVLKMMLSNEYNRVLSLSFDEKHISYEITFESASDGNIYTVYFSFSSCFFQFDEFGSEAWYLTYANRETP